MRTLVLSVLCATFMAFITGCTSGVYNREALGKVKRVAIISISTDHLPKKDATPGNNQVLKEVMAESVDVLAKELESLCGWKVLRFDHVKNSSAFQATVAKLEANAAYSFYDRHRAKNWFCPDGLPDVPKSYLSSEDKTQEVVAAQDALKKMCADLDVDDSHRRPRRNVHPQSMLQRHGLRECQNPLQSPRSPARNQVPYIPLAGRELLRSCWPGRSQARLLQSSPYVGRQ